MKIESLLLDAYRLVATDFMKAGSPAAGVAGTLFPDPMTLLFTMLTSSSLGSTVPLDSPWSCRVRDARALTGRYFTATNIVYRHSRVPWATAGGHGQTTNSSEERQRCLDPDSYLRVGLSAIV